MRKHKFDWPDVAVLVVMWALMWIVLGLLLGAAYSLFMAGWRFAS